MRELEPYEVFYYGGQVEGRGLRTTQELRGNFQDRAHVYDEVFGASLDHLKPLAAIDLACGYGNFLFYLESRGWLSASGVDLDINQVNLARSIGLDAKLDDAIAALSRGLRFGLISGFDLIEHLSKNDAVQLLMRAKESLTEGGALIIQCPCADGFRGANDFCNDLTHIWAPTSVVLRQMLSTAGFKTVEIVDLSLVPYPSSIKRKLLMVSRRIARKLMRPLMSLLGVQEPPVWSNSMIAIAWNV